MLRMINQSTDKDMLILETTTAEDTKILGRFLARILVPGSIISLTGDLGAGKTTLTRGLANELGCQGPVASPTFTLLMEHPAGDQKMALYHFDAYRLDGPDAFLELGFDEYFDRGGICVIEWGDRIGHILPSRTIQIELARHDHSAMVRRIHISQMSDVQRHQLIEWIKLYERPVTREQQPE